MWECWQGISYTCASSGDSWQSPGLHWQEHSTCGEVVFPLCSVLTGAYLDTVSSFTHSPPVEYRKGSDSLGWIQCRPTTMAMAGAPSLWTEAERPGIILPREATALGVTYQWPYSTYEKVTMKTKTGSSEVHGGRMRDKTCTSKQGNFWLDARKVILPKDSQSIRRLPRDTTTSPSLEVFKTSWTKPWVIWGLLQAGGWVRWAQKVLFLPETVWHSCKLLFVLKETASIMTDYLLPHREAKLWWWPVGLLSKNTVST